MTDTEKAILQRARERALTAGRNAARRHDEHHQDADDFTVCKCQAFVAPDVGTWADHYADATLTAAINAIDVVELREPRT